MPRKSPQPTSILTPTPTTIKSSLSFILSSFLPSFGLIYSARHSYQASPIEFATSNKCPRNPTIYIVIVVQVVVVRVVVVWVIISALDLSPSSFPSKVPMIFHSHYNHTLRFIFISFFPAELKQYRILGLIDAEQRGRILSTQHQSKTRRGPRIMDSAWGKILWRMDRNCWVPNIPKKAWLMLAIPP